MIALDDPETLTPSLVRDACTWRNDHTAVLRVYSALFDSAIEAHILVKTPGAVSDAEVSMLADVMRVPMSERTLLQTMLWHDAIFAFETMSYGVDVDPGESEAEANKRTFAIQTPEAALAKSTLLYALVCEPEEPFVNRYAILVMECPWGDLNEVIIKNGHLVDVYENGAYLGFWEPGGRYADTPSYLAHGER